MVTALRLPALAVLFATVAVVHAWAQGAVLPDIRVVLSDTGATCSVSGDLVWYADDAGIGSSNDTVRISLQGSRLTGTMAGKQHSAARFVAEARSGYVSYGSSSYRGRVEFFAGQGGGLVVMNVLPLEDYLAGVVPREMPPSWRAEALQAQAVAARTYAVSRMAANQGRTYDVYATVADQAYQGVTGETGATSAAVQATAGQILTYNGAPITAYYSSDAGGYTKAGGSPYLQAVPSYAPDSPHNDWEIRVTLEELAGLVSASGGTTDQPRRVSARYTPVSGHLNALIIESAAGIHEISGEKLRQLLGANRMKSTLVKVLADGTVVGGADSSAPVKHAGPLAPLPAAMDTVQLFGFHRPWVASADDLAGLKLRSLYAYDGFNLEQCNREVYAFAGFSADQSLTGVLPPRSDVRPDMPSAPVGPDGITLKGSGYGHGVGMSQWGAKQLAGQGRTYREILQYFYRGTDLVIWTGDLPLPVEDDAGAGFYRPFTPGY